MNGDAVASGGIKMSRGWTMAFGILLILLGTAAIISPFVFSYAIKVIIGWLLLIGGVIQIIHTFQAKGVKGVLLHILGALLYLAAGIYLLAFPLQGLLTLTLLLAIFFIVEGIVKIIWSFQVKGHGPWGWVLFSGLVSLALGVLIYHDLPSSAAWAIGLLLGINMIFLGWSLVMIAAAMKKAE
ncbi:MAG: HdeD family acid-resistance protein [bacterium]|nr:HdeD family acid-resistance protein [bacterium]